MFSPGILRPRGMGAIFWESREGQYRAGAQIPPFSANISFRVGEGGKIAGNTCAARIDPRGRCYTVGTLLFPEILLINILSPTPPLVPGELPRREFTDSATRSVVCCRRPDTPGLAGAGLRKARGDIRAAGAGRMLSDHMEHGFDGPRVPICHGDPNNIEVCRRYVHQWSPLTTGSPTGNTGLTSGRCLRWLHLSHATVVSP